MSRVTDEPHATGPAAGDGHAGPKPAETNAFRTAPSNAPQSAALPTSAQSARPTAPRQPDERPVTRWVTPTGWRLIGLVGSVGVAVAGTRPVGLVGVAVLAGAWLALRKVTSFRWMLVTAGLWALPLLLAPPLFSGDAMAYACQGELVAHGLSPYQHGVADLPCRWLDRVPALWWHTPTPYGPLWVAVTGAAATGFGRRLGPNPAWLAGAGPLVLLHGVSGAHNDALLAGLVVAGLALAMDARWGLVAGALLGLAVAVKVTALVAVPFAALYVARRRAWAGVAAGAAAAFAAVTAATGLGLGWLPALSHTAGLTQWTSPPTGVGMAAGYLLRAAGRQDLVSGAVAVARAAGLLALAVVLAWLWWRPRPWSAGAALAATALLGPAFYPWYALPALAVLAAAPLSGRVRGRLGLGVAGLALLVLPNGDGLAAMTKPVGAVLDVVLVTAVLVGLVRRHRGGRATPTPTAR